MSELRFVNCRPPSASFLKTPSGPRNAERSPVDRQERFGEQADSVLRLCVADPESDVGKVFAGDVRDAARGPGQRHAVATPRRKPGSTSRPQPPRAAARKRPLTSRLPPDVAVVRAERAESVPIGASHVCVRPHRSPSLLRCTSTALVDRSVLHSSSNVPACPPLRKPEPNGSHAGRTASLASRSRTTSASASSPR